MATQNWATIGGPYKDKARRKYEVRAKSYALSVHRTKAGAQLWKAKLEKRFADANAAVRALAQRNYRPFNE